MDTVRFNIPRPFVKNDGRGITRVDFSEKLRFKIKNLNLKAKFNYIKIPCLKFLYIICILLYTLQPLFRVLHLKNGVH